MALHQIISTDYGVNASYWKVIDVHFNRFDKTVKIDVAGYLDKDSRDNGANVLKTFQYTVPESSVCSEDPENNVVHIIYDLIKTLGDFNTAIDC
jgi:hypothetical protein